MTEKNPLRTFCKTKIVYQKSAGNKFEYVHVFYITNVSHKFISSCTVSEKLNTMPGVEIFIHT